MTTKSNLWPDFKFEEIETPLAIIQKQAVGLGERTKNVLLGEIITTEAYNEKTGESALIYQFYIKAPILSNYRYLLFRLLQKTKLYPIELYFISENRKFDIDDAKSFEERLSEIFNNPVTKETINNLYAQSKQLQVDSDEHYQTAQST